MRLVLALALLVLAAPHVLAQEGEPTQEEIAAQGRMWVLVTFVLLALGVGAMIWVNRFYHPPGEKVRRKSRRD